MTPAAEWIVCAAAAAVVLPVAGLLLPALFVQAALRRLTDDGACPLERRCALDAFEAGVSNMNTRLAALETALAPEKGGAR